MLQITTNSLPHLNRALPQHECGVHNVMSFKDCFWRPKWWSNVPFQQGKLRVKPLRVTTKVQTKCANNFLSQHCCWFCSSLCSSFHSLLMPKMCIFFLATWKWWLRWKLEWEVHLQLAKKEGRQTLSFTNKDGFPVAKCCR